MLAVDQNPSVDIQKKMAKFFIDENRLEEALDIYMNILHTDPEDPEVLKVIGELYLAAGNGQVAAKVLRAVSQKFPGDEELFRKIEMAGRNVSANCQEEPIPTSPEALRRLLQTLTHREEPVSEEEMIRAATLLNEIVSSPRPAVEVSQRLEEIDSLLPALIDLNIQQAKHDGRPDLAAGLQNLKNNIHLQKSIQKTAAQELRLDNDDMTGPVEKFTGKVVVFQPGNESAASNNRIRLLQTTLEAEGCLVRDTGLDDHPDLAVFSNPFLDPQLMEKMVKYSASGVPVILDLDQYYDQNFFPGLNSTSGGIMDQVVDRAYVSSLILADLITVTSEAYAKNLRSSGYPAMAISNSWSIQNPYWAEKVNTVGATLQLGWFGSSGNLEDLAVIRRPLIRILNEFNDKIRLIIVGDQDAYRMFDHVSDSLKTFIPGVGEDDLPYLINQMDILLMPLRKTPGNQMRSDDILMYAGIKKLPWIASPFPAAMDWKKGGVICSTAEEWHTNLRFLILDKDFRRALGSDGFHKATRREMLVHIQQWYRAFSLVCPLKKS